jgi:DNA-binding NarL/FixJ family response regulator
MITILLAEDHAMVRTGLRLVLEREGDMTVVAEAVDGIEAVALALQLRPMVVVMDIGLPTMDGLDALARIKAAAPRMRVLMMTALEDDAYLLRALREGASGFVRKQSRPETLVAAVRAVARGELAFGGMGVSDHLAAVQHGQSAPQPPRHSELTQREREVLALVAQGHSNSAIAGRLGISPKTVDTHRTRLMDKLGLHSRAGLTHYALQHGFVIDVA